MRVKSVDHSGGKGGRHHVPVELLNILATIAAALGVVAAGAAISAALPQPTPWMLAACYAAPAAIAFAIYWWIAQRL